MLKALVAPLDWGLGHATRCIPIVKELLSQHCTVIIAACGDQKAVLQEEFPDLLFVEIPGFRVKYGKNRAFTLLKIILQIPKILISIKGENQWVRRFARQEGLDVVISDNRFGLYGSGVVSVFVTHQLAIRSSFGRAVDKCIRKANYRFISRFSVCWVPDSEGRDNLAGLLSHPPRMPKVPVRYIGLLSRLRPASGITSIAGGPDLPQVAAKGGDWVEAGEVDLLVLLSGPEPQRTILESVLWPQLSTVAGKVVVVRGLPTGGLQIPTPPIPAVPIPATPIPAPPNIAIFDYLGARDLERVICQSRIVLGRSGYSTIMDLVRLRRRAVYVPTPGQPEQEYLGRYMEERGLGVCINQQGLVLTEAIRRSDLLMHLPVPPAIDEPLLKQEVARLLEMARTAAAASTQSAVADLG